MKFIVILSGVLLLLTAPAFAELSAEDIGKIRVIVNAEVSASETRIKEHVSQEVKTLNVKIDEMDKRLAGRIDEMDKQYDRLFTLVTVLLTAVIAIIGIPLAMILYLIRKQERREHTQNERIERLWRDLEERRQGRIVTP